MEDAIVIRRALRRGSNGANGIRKRTKMGKSTDGRMGGWPIRLLCQFRCIGSPYVLQPPAFRAPKAPLLRGQFTCANRGWSSRMSPTRQITRTPPYQYIAD